MSSDVWLPLTEASRRIKAKELSPVEYVSDLISHIEEYNPTYRVFIEFTPDLALGQARKAAREIAKGEWKGALHGIPYALKDMIDYAGVATTAHSAVLASHVARADAEVTRSLKRAGGVFLGKLACHSFGIGMSDDLPWPHAVNPWNPAYFAGGSSSGSGVAVAAGFTPLALGTDTGGSVRSPASMCGVVGMKPTYDVLGRQGVVPLSYSLDHVGVLTRTVGDNALALSELVANQRPRSDVGIPSIRHPYAEPAPDSARGARVALIRHFYDRDMEGDSVVKVATDDVARVMERLGAHVEEVELEALQTYSACARVILHSEAFAIHRQWLRDRPEKYGAATRERLLAGAFATAASYVDAQRVRRRLQHSFADTLSKFDVGITVGSLDPPCTMDDRAGLEGMYYRQARMPFNLIGNPAVSIPIGLSPDGVPLGVQIVGKPHQDAAVYSLAAAYELSEGGLGHPTLSRKVECLL